MGLQAAAASPSSVLNRPINDHNATFRVLCYDLGSATMLLENEGLAIAVDISLCLSSGGSLPWLVEARSVVTAFAYLERPPQVTYFTSNFNASRRVR